MRLILDSVIIDHHEVRIEALHLKPVNLVADLTNPMWTGSCRTRATAA
ncbi:MAG: hypothetical protein QOI46_2188 [Alphaproteobacteria bacterium]|jgi:hypothetical protein|nr:hypothetical protein [Alphaproteobacteria bacterium]